MLYEVSRRGKVSHASANTIPCALMVSKLEYVSLAVGGKKLHLILVMIHDCHQFAGEGRD